MHEEKFEGFGFKLKKKEEFKIIQAYLENTKDNHNKFYRVEKFSKFGLYKSYGSIGKSRTLIKEYSLTEKEVESKIKKIIFEKIKKGYVLVETVVSYKDPITKRSKRKIITHNNS